MPAAALQTDVTVISSSPAHTHTHLYICVWAQSNSINKSGLSVFRGSICFSIPPQHRGPRHVWKGARMTLRLVQMPETECYSKEKRRRNRRVCVRARRALDYWCKKPSAVMPSRGNFSSQNGAHAITFGHPEVHASYMPTSVFFSLYRHHINIRSSINECVQASGCCIVSFPFTPFVTSLYSSHPH